VYGKMNQNGLHELEYKLKIAEKSLSYV